MAPSEIKSSKNPGPRPSANAMVENVLKCKWSLTVLQLVRRGTRRPGAMERAVPGLTAKVLNERLRKLVRYGVFSRKIFPEIPPRVEYSLTVFGSKFAAIIDSVEKLQQEINRTS